MKATITMCLMRSAVLGGCLAGVLCCAACETTGDPTTGGIFWSEAKAQQRLAEKQRRLDQLEGRTAKTKASSNRHEAEIDSMER